MENSEGYLKIHELKDGVSYIYSMSEGEHVGVWNEKKCSFITAKYSYGAAPRISSEYHWDYGDTMGTVKPIAEIETCPFPGNKQNDDENKFLLYFEKLEQENPVVPSYDTVKQRQYAAIHYEEYLTCTRKYTYRAIMKDKDPVWKTVKR